MGYWNGTCGVTQLPIFYGDEVILIPIVEQPRYEKGLMAGYCYPDDVYFPCSVPIVGKYNDYGMVEEIKDSPFHEIFLSVIKRLLKQNQLSINIDRFKTYWPKDVDKITTDIECLLATIERGCLHSKLSMNSTGETEYLSLNVSFMMVIKRIYDKIVKIIGDRKPYKYTTTFRELIYRDLIHFKKEYHDIVNSNHKPEIKHTSLSMLYSSNAVTSFFVKFSGGSIKHVDMTSYIEFLANSDTYDEMIDLFLFHDYMYLARRCYMPQAGGGSQRAELYLPKIVAEEVIAIEQEYNDRYLEKENRYDTVL